LRAWTIAAEATTAALKELREFAQVARIDVSGWQLSGCIGWRDATQPIAHVIREVALAQLTIIDDVDADLGLFSDYLLDGGGQVGHVRWTRRGARV
jgi:hypothetical protein